MPKLHADCQDKPELQVSPSMPLSAHENPPPLHFKFPRCWYDSRVTDLLHELIHHPPCPLHLVLLLGYRLLREGSQV